VSIFLLLDIQVSLETSELHSNPGEIIVVAVVTVLFIFFRNEDIRQMRQTKIFLRIGARMADLELKF